MNDIKTFLKGAAVGMAVLIAGNSVFTGLERAYARSNQLEMSPSQKIDEIFSVLDENYVDSYDKQALTETMYTGMVYGVGDPYTTYMDKATLSQFYEQTSGKYAGIGVKIDVDTTDNRIRIASVFEGSPSERAGLLIEDKIIKVSGFSVYADASEDAIAMIKGTPGTTVTLTIHRELDNSTFEVDVMREDISVPTVAHQILDGDIGYLRLSGFERVTYDQFADAYQSLENEQMKGLILDVRNNPGGLLDVVIKIADDLLPKGVIVYTEDKNGKQEFAYSNEKHINVPLVILVNGNSASASEVLSGAVQDTGLGELVGTQTYGKGLVQNLFNLPDGSGIKVTIAKYYTPNGICINGEGLTPNHVVDMDKEKTVNIGNLTVEEDPQLLRAIEVMNTKIN